uniref:Uncharacterized protein n=1 Tax=Meloidogyne enterolobii TaxID=390850 RepID=A0A6V7XTC2_MELEN|nr:unnamed protein product [Meloidogyne enterolobii]
MYIDGDFIMATPLFIEEFDGVYLKHDTERFNVVNMPSSFMIAESISADRYLRFRFIIHNEATKFSIKLLNGVEEENPYSNNLNVFQLK